MPGPQACHCIPFIFCIVGRGLDPSGGVGDAAPYILGRELSANRRGGLPPSLAPLVRKFSQQSVGDGYAPAPNYNLLPRPATVMLSGGKSYIAIRRETFEDLCACDL